MKLVSFCIVLFCITFVQAQNYQFLGNYTANGTPLYLAQPADMITNETMELVDNSLPESFPVPDYNPHYISAGYETDVILNEDAEVWVTFVKEGAGYKNVLGFYTYDTNNPIQTAPQPQDITIIFPNVSASGSGGGLHAGDKVKIGQFPAGTGIGWVLLADAWENSTSSVGYGSWQLYSDPDFNPEQDPDLRHHNVLLNDDANERVILGFEDIRRDFSSCDNDFNDAVFYVTSNPYTAIETNNIADVSSATDVTTANDGGLESNGSLAQRIARRNLLRQKTGSAKDKRKLQNEFHKTIGSQVNKKTNSSALNLNDILPDTGMYGTETAYESTPNDLLGITNATDVFSVDYYQGNKRVAAALATSTQGSVYDHSKVICDRLKSSVLQDVRTVMVKGHKIIISETLRATGEKEYSLSFSIKEGNLSNELFSFWNIDEYPVGDYHNFQVWGSSYSQIFAISNYILDAFSAQKPLISQDTQNIVPPVFVSSGYYAEGKVYLDLINTINATSVNFNANIKVTETASSQSFYQNIPLSGNWNETLTIDTGQLFDIGFSISVSSSYQDDALYLADGPWGLDYLDPEVSITNFSVLNNSLNDVPSLYNIERKASVTGNVKGTVNLFRHLSAGEQSLDVHNFQSVTFSINNSHPVEVVLVEDGLDDWNDRLRYTVPANVTESTYQIAFDEFVDGQGNGVDDLDALKTIVFSLQGNFTNFQGFNFNVDALAFSETSTLSNESFEVTRDKQAFVYPNPMSERTKLSFVARQEKDVSIKMFDISGQLVLHKKVSTSVGNNEIKIQRNGIKKGVYIINIKGLRIGKKHLKLVVE